MAYWRMGREAKPVSGGGDYWEELVDGEWPSHMLILPSVFPPAPAFVAQGNYSLGICSPVIKLLSRRRVSGLEYKGLLKGTPS